MKKSKNNSSLKDTVNHISENTILKERALTSFMLYMLSINKLNVVCIANTTDISPYMERRITYLASYKLDIEEYMQIWKDFVKAYCITFKEGELEEIIYEIARFSVKNKISIRTIGQFVLFFHKKEVSLSELFTYCKRIEE
jgi:hypothetical protein